MADAPSAFSFSSVSQKTASWHTAWTATASSRPDRGMTVGDPAPGNRAVIRSSAARGAFSITYLAP